MKEKGSIELNKTNRRVCVCLLSKLRCVNVIGYVSLSQSQFAWLMVIN
jgi:hypothetical protein